MYLLDTDILSLAFRGHRQISERILLTSPADICTSSISAEEMLQGLLAEINRSRTSLTIGMGVPSAALVKALEDLARIRVVAYSDEAERLYRSFPASVKRIGGMDCRIAAHALTGGLTVVTRNTQDFERIPGVKIEDWSG